MSYKSDNTLLNKIFDKSAYLNGITIQETKERSISEANYDKTSQPLIDNANPNTASNKKELQSLVEIQKNITKELLGLNGKRITAGSKGNFGDTSSLLILPRGKQAFSNFQKTTNALEEFRFKRTNKNKLKYIPESTDKHMIDRECTVYSFPRNFCTHCASNEIKEHSSCAVSLELIGEEHYLLRQENYPFEKDDMLLYWWCKYCYKHYQQVTEYINKYGKLPPLRERIVTPLEYERFKAKSDKELHDDYVEFTSLKCFENRIIYIFNQMLSWDKSNDEKIGSIERKRVRPNIRKAIKIDTGHGVVRHKTASQLVSDEIDALSGQC